MGIFAWPAAARLECMSNRNAIKIKFQFLFEAIRETNKRDVEADVAVAAAAATAAEQFSAVKMCNAITSLSLISKFHIQDANKMIMKIRQQNVK